MAKFSYFQILAFAMHLFSIVSRVESIGGMTGPQKLAMAQELATAVVQDLGIGSQVSADKITVAINGLVAVLNVFVK